MLKLMYITIVLKNVVEHIIMLYCCDYFSFLTEEKCSSIKTKLNNRSFITVYIFLIFNDVIILCQVS